MGCLSKVKKPAVRKLRTFLRTYRCDGFLGVINGSGPDAMYWTGCREQFHIKTRRTSKSFYFAIAPQERVPKIAETVDFVQDLLRLKPIYCARLYQCKRSPNQHPTMAMLYIRTGDFWRSSNLRHQFFTALLKTANMFPDQRPLEKIRNSPYFNRTPRATAIFISGHTADAAKINSGWVTSLSRPRSSRKLFQPRKKDDRKFFQDEKPRSQLTKEQKEELRQWIMRVEGCRILKEKLRNCCPFTFSNAPKP